MILISFGCTISLSISRYLFFCLYIKLQLVFLILSNLNYGLFWRWILLVLFLIRQKRQFAFTPYRNLSLDIPEKPTSLLFLATRIDRGFDPPGLFLVLLLLLPLDLFEPFVRSVYAFPESHLIAFPRRA